ncbi:Nicastrin [Musa troglodytarum]|uniref:Nicastrin n=1 Tax=Musa troglodytarum TaxID=320322 RepID=A0A9E7HJM8_9LILI|nr:Nicastrin [Musa troglodytarum]
MAGRSKQWLLIGAGAIFGSLTTAALLKILSRKVGKQQVGRHSTDFLMHNGMNGKENPAGGGRTGCQDIHNGLLGFDLEDEVVCEQLTRNIQFFGIEFQQKVLQAYVVVIGLGGVGSHAAAMLLRSGVGRLLLVDFDQVSLSSLNRHAVANRDDVGTPKAICLQKHFAAIFPECVVEARVQLYDPSSEEEILSGHPDFVLDCIDNIDTKVALLAACVRRGLKVLSAMGAGARADPTRIRVADIRESTNDPLSRAVRYRLRKDHGIEGGIPVVFSLEKPKVKLLPFKSVTGEEENPSDYQIVPGFRVRIIPVLGTIPAIFGQVMASYVVTQFSGLYVQTEPVVNLDIDHYRILHNRLLEHEEIIYGSATQVMVDVEEVMYVVKELWHGRSARDQSKDVGRKMWRSVNELMLVRWDKSKPATISNLILLKLNEVDAHESTTIDHIKGEEPEFYSMSSSSKPLRPPAITRVSPPLISSPPPWFLKFLSSLSPLPFSLHLLTALSPGSGIMSNQYNFPVFLLSPETKSVVQELAGKNAGGTDLYQVIVAEFDLVMQGLIALLAAVDALSRVDDLNELKKQLVFVVFTGEAWGYLGSRKFLQELDLGADAVNGLNNTLIEQVLEIGSVGKGLDQATRATTFYAHAGGDSPVTKDMLKALQNASDSLGSDNVKIKAADVSNPGIPPSSLMTFLRKNSSAAGIVLEDFDSFFTNKFYHTNINSSSIAAAAALVARTLYILASGDVTVCSCLFDPTQN